MLIVFDSHTAVFTENWGWQTFYVPYQSVKSVYEIERGWKIFMLQSTSQSPMTKVGPRFSFNMMSKKRELNDDFLEVPSDWKLIPASEHMMNSFVALFKVEMGSGNGKMIRYCQYSFLNYSHSKLWMRICCVRSHMVLWQSFKNTFMTLKQAMYLFTKVLIVTWKPEKLEFEHFLMKS